MRPLLLVVGLLAGVMVEGKVDDECILASSCGQCIQRGPQCAWCIDPASTLSFRCQKKEKLEGKCPPSNIFSPVTGSESPPGSFRIGQIGHHNATVMMEPQIVTMKVKMGEAMRTSFKYKHVRPANDQNAVNVQLQHSELPAHLNVKFFITCKGKKEETKQCSNVPDGEMMDIELQVTLKNCAQVTGTQTFSLGVVGYRGVAGIYVNPLCGCECEISRFSEKASPFCSKAGTLICGQCAGCDAGRGGSNCECSLAEHGVKSYRELEEKCRETPGGPICNGSGKCACGKCKCDSNTVAGPFCACDNTSCPVGGAENRQCSGRGLCKCGTCECEEGWEREDCSCEKSEEKCIENGKLCGEHGHCECGKCVCDAGWTGAFCSANEGGSKSDKNTAGGAKSAMKKKEDATGKSSAECGDDDECALPSQKLDDDSADKASPDAGVVDYQSVLDNLDDVPIDEPVLVPASGITSTQQLQKEAGAEEQSSSAASLATVLIPLLLARFL